jgi:hypothetical protein
VAPALHLKTLRQMALELDRLSARYARMPKQKRFG